MSNMSNLESDALQRQKTTSGGLSVSQKQETETQLEHGHQHWMEE